MSDSTQTPTQDEKPSASSFLNSLKEDAQSIESTFSESLSGKKKTETSTIGKGIKFRGELIGTEDLHVEGKVEGTVLMKGQNLSIGEEGELNANIHVQNIRINGKLTGDVLADELIEIKNTAVVKGNLIAPRIQLEDGGKFRGSMDMVDTDDEKRERNEQFKSKLVHPDLPHNKEASMVTGKPVSTTPANNKPLSNSVSAKKDNKADTANMTKDNQ